MFIYFSDDALRGVVKVLLDRMPQNGVLFLGAAEALTRLGVNFELAEVGRGFAYVKGGQRDAIEALRPPRAQPTLQAPSASAEIRP